MDFLPWYKEEIKKILVALLSCFVKPIKKISEPIKEILVGCAHDLTNPIAEVTVSLVGLISAFAVLICLLSSVLPWLYGLYSLIATPIYITLFAHGHYRDTHRPIQPRLP